ncbi:gamma carbonic anhydrase family protein [Capillimicrobium parvum]|uniref:Protein YrdA n=1 Tax=Capillimicrobium parvum TaxID=2884022 RepID=A0A9E6XW73_9ACTN|nr:gamma carbonic anhydrase family protein [Capillimicrobium parvum]UGS35555.1 Protein YrdA [Capillimicrobium parvum]
MAHLIEFEGASPTIGEDVYLAPTAVLIGDVHVGDRSSIWFGAVLRGDNSEIRIGARTSVQDNVVVHCARDLPTVVGDDVVVGHGALLEGCVIEDGALVGMGAIALQRSRLGRRALLAAGAVLGEGTKIGDEMLAAGIPATEKKRLSGSALGWVDGGADEYVRLRARYLSASAELIPD